MARVAADPAVVPAAAEPGGWDGLVYYRLHGSPKVYYSAYPDEYLEALAKTLVRAAKSADVWCIFDNTAAFAATANALDRARPGSGGMNRRLSLIEPVAGGAACSSHPNEMRPRRETEAAVSSINLPERPPPLAVLPARPPDHPLLKS